jgi:hypothetical protein
MSSWVVADVKNTSIFRHQHHISGDIHARTTLKLYLTSQTGLLQKQKSDDEKVNF